MVMGPAGQLAECRVKARSCITLFKPIGTKPQAEKLG